MISCFQIDFIVFLTSCISRCPSWSSNSFIDAVFSPTVSLLSPGRIRCLLLCRGFVPFPFDIHFGRKLLADFR